MFVALLDTSVLWPSRQRDFLLSLAAEGFYRPIWSGAILVELEEAEAVKLLEMGLPEEEARYRAKHLIEHMRAAFDDAEVDGWEALAGSYGLRDPSDEHVLAAAVVGQAGAIVTSDRDFEPDKLPFGLSVVNPADFAVANVVLDPRRALRAVEEMVSRLGRKGPSQSFENVLDYLESRYGMHEAIELLRQSM